METKNWRDIKDKDRTPEHVARLDAEVSAETMALTGDLKASMDALTDLAKAATGQD